MMRVSGNVWFEVSKRGEHQSVMFDDESEWQRLVRMFVCDVMFDDESEWQRLVRSEQKR